MHNRPCTLQNIGKALLLIVDSLSFIPLTSTSGWSTTQFVMIQRIDRTESIAVYNVNKGWAGKGYGIVDANYVDALSIGRTMLIK